MPYARNTIVPVEKTKMEIEKLVKVYGAKGFASGWHEGTARIQFFAQQRHVRFTIVIPDNERDARQRWRTLLLLVKAKLVAVDSKVVTFEEAFVGDIVMPDTGKTVWESIREPIKLSYQMNKSLPLLPGALS
jgi:hypothetical protein